MQIQLPSFFFSKSDSSISVAVFILDKYTVNIFNYRWFVLVSSGILITYFDSCKSKNTIHYEY